MTWAVHPAAPMLVGREKESRLLREALRRTAEGVPVAVLVSGEAGVGKTRLVRDVVTEAVERDGVVVRWGTCVQFGASTLPFAPLLSALRGDLPIAAASADQRLLPTLDGVVNGLAAQHPTVLVVDDLQWADESSLDVLAYLITGFGGQRLAVVATCRQEPRAEGHPLFGWLADMRRMPSFREMVLPRLDLDQTSVLLARLRDEAPDLELAALVRERSDGNPYLVELLSAAIPPGAHRLPTTAPRRLEDALTGTWHRLGAGARTLTRLLAVGGRPVELSVLSAVARRHGLAAADVVPALAAAEVQGVVSQTVDGRYWFRHPMLADVLYDGTPADTRRRLHATFAELLAAQVPPVPADLATHHEHAGNLVEAFRWSRRAADDAAALHASVEQARQLLRACRLWTAAHDGPARKGSVGDRVDLLAEAARATHRVRWYADARRLLEEALGLVDRAEHPLLASRLVSAWCEVTWDASGPSIAVVPELADALRLTDAHPDSPERAWALAALADAEMWDGDYDAAHRHADQALAVARRSGSSRALAGALNTWASASSVRASTEEARAATRAALEQALRLAREASDVEQIVSSTIWLMNALEDDGRLEQAAEVGASAVVEAQRLGDRHWSWFVAAMTAGELLMLGRFAEARLLLRTTLAARCLGVPGALTRFAAAELAVRTGDLDAARQHLDRALELVDPGFGGLLGSLVGTVVEVRLAEGRPREALDWVDARLRPEGRLDPRVPRSWVLRWVARSLADLAERARALGDAAAEEEVLGELADWVDVLADARALGGTVRAGDRLDLAVAAAEVARCRDDADVMERWEEVTRLSRSAGMRWCEVCATARQVETSVRHGAPRAEVTPLVRRLHRLAGEIGATPLVEQAERWARVTRVSLREPSPLPRQRTGAPGRAGPVDRLTAREREILAHLVAGRTNVEIAAALVISEKTVSVHVSAILRKTGTSSRSEAAARALRPG